MELLQLSIPLHQKVNSHVGIHKGELSTHVREHMASPIVIVWYVYPLVENISNIEVLSNNVKYIPNEHIIKTLTTTFSV